MPRLLGIRERLFGLSLVSNANGRTLEVGNGEENKASKHDTREQSFTLKSCARASDGAGQAPAPLSFTRIEGSSRRLTLN